MITLRFTELMQICIDIMNKLEFENVAEKSGDVLVTLESEVIGLEQRISIGVAVPK